MPYYCTVPRCTSMAGKTKNVSFHKFPRDQELAKLWNRILKRGKPYTKYSKVCSLHFKLDDYTVAGPGRNKGQWRTLRKDAIPSQNLPCDSPAQCHRIKNKSSRLMSIPTGIMDTQLQQVAHAIYTQTILAISASRVGDLGMTMCNENGISPNREDSTSRSSNSSGQFSESISQIENLLHKNKINTDIGTESAAKYNDENINMLCEPNVQSNIRDFGLKHTYKCTECSKCFKDPDVFILHKRIHMPNNTDMNALRIKISENVSNEKENYGNNTNGVEDSTTEETLRANPILANLLKSSVPTTTEEKMRANPILANLLKSNTTIQKLHQSETQQMLDYKSVTSIENQIMAAEALTKMNFLRNLSSVMTETAIIASRNLDNEIGNSVCESRNSYTEECSNSEDYNDIIKEETNDFQQCMQLDEETKSLDFEYDSKDLNDSVDSSTLEIKEEFEEDQLCDLTI